MKLRLMPVTEAAVEAGVSRTTVFNYIALGLVRRYRRPGLDRRTFVNVDEVIALRSRSDTYVEIPPMMFPHVRCKA